MSDYETHKGKITKVELDKPIIEFVKDLAGPLPSYYNNPTDESYLEYFRDEYDDRYIIHDGNLYSISDERYDDCSDIKIVEEGIECIEYVFRFYNGGTCLYEQIEEALDEIKEK